MDGVILDLRQKRSGEDFGDDTGDCFDSEVNTQNIWNPASPHSYGRAKISYMQLHSQTRCNKVHVTVANLLYACRSR